MINLSTYFETTVLGVLEKYTQDVKMRVKGKPASWLSHDIRELIILRNNYSKIFKKSRLEEDWNKYRQTRSLVTNEIRKAKEKYFKSKFEEVSKSSSIWKIFKDFSGGKASEPEISELIIDGERTSNPVTISNHLSETFVLSSNPEEQSEIQILKDSIESTSEQITVTENDIIKCATSLKKKSLSSKFDITHNSFSVSNCTFCPSVPSFYPANKSR